MEPPPSSPPAKPAQSPGDSAVAPANGEQQQRQFLEVVRDLSVELHPHRGNQQVSLHSALDSELGFDSLSRVELLLRIEQHFGLALPEHVMAAAETPGDLLRALLAKDAPTTPGTRPAAPMPDLVLGDAEAAPDRASTLQEVLEWHVEQHSERTHVSFYNEAGGTELMSYGDLLQAASRVAGGLQALDVKPGATVAIMLPTCLEYFHSFMGVLLAGATPVPIYPPARPSQIEDHLRRHVSILNNARATVLISFPEAKIAARLLRMQVLSLGHIVTAEELGAAAVPGEHVPAAPSDIAHLQYTSGSTGNPKGVVLTHANLLANVRAMAQAVGVDSTDVFVSWLPLYHDMGLIGAWMGSLYSAMPLVLMSPLTFLARPERWLRAMSDHRGTITGGPNFAYELCLRRISDEQLAGLDLSSWRLGLNGAEPVIPETLRRFQERFEPYGLRRDAQYPVYGLAECAVGLAFPPLGRPYQVDNVQRDTLILEGRAVPAEPDDANALQFVACGQPLPGHEVRVVNEADSELGEREEGRLQFRGPSATSGYYRRPEETKALFHGDWLDSGDMAYISGGDIYLTGRRKDIIIRAGRNIYPHELEEAIGNLEGIRKGCVAVFGSKDERSGTERLVAVAESREQDPAALERLQSAVQALAVDLLGTPLDDLVLAPPHSVPKTSSGKIRRNSARELYEQGGVGAGTRAVWLQVIRLWLAGLAPQMRRARRLVQDSLYGAWWIVVVGLVVPPAWALVLLTPSRQGAWALFRGAARLLVGLMRLPVTVRGLEHLPSGPCVLAINHASYLDGLFVPVALPGAWSFVAKRELVSNPFAHAFLKRLGTEFVERFDKQRGAEDARRTAHAVAEGRSLIFFPEGTFRRQPGLLPFHMGAFQAAVEAGAPIIPIIMRGPRSVLRDGHHLLRRAPVSVQVLEPITADGSGWQAALELRERTRAAMLKVYGEPDLADQPVRW